MDIAQWKKDYDENAVLDCPCCGNDRPEHFCKNCYAEMTKEICWIKDGHCSDACKKYVTEELPRIREQKSVAGMACKCDEKYCGKCLGISCKDQGCPTHTDEAKRQYKLRNKISD